MGYTNISDSEYVEAEQNNYNKLLEMYFRGYAKIDLDAIYHNLSELKGNLKEDTGVVAVIKTDGYGHGAVPIARTIDDIVTAYAVATVFEAVNLRRHGISKPIMILGYTNEATYDMAIENNIWMVVYDYEMAKKMSDHALKLGKKANVNIAIDTGMSRIGFLAEDKSCIDTIENIHKLNGLEILGIFTHFAKADETCKDVAISQLNMFNNVIEELENKGVHIPYKHCANSAAIMELPQTSMDLSRAGISMYGLDPSDEVDKTAFDLKPALSLYSHVTDVKIIGAGRGVSYGHTYVADKDIKVATIPLGYGDGYMRNLSNKGYVLIAGKKARIIGRVCMDQFMVDATGIDVKIGDLVTLIGSDGNNTITMEEIAGLAGTFNYEVACNLGKRVPRVYYKDGKIVGCKDYYLDDYTMKFEI